MNDGFGDLHFGPSLPVVVVEGFFSLPFGFVPPLKRLPVNSEPVSFCLFALRCSGRSSDGFAETPLSGFQARRAGATKSPNVAARCQVKLAIGDLIVEDLQNIVHEDLSEADAGTPPPTNCCSPWFRR